MKKLVTLMAVCMSLGQGIQAQEQLKYSDFESWITRQVKESWLVGGKTQTLYEIGPTQTWPKNTAYKNQGGSPWGTSNAYAKVSGIVKSNASVYSDTHGSGKCVKLQTHIVKCKAAGIINISVLAAGSLFTGELVEPITSSSNPMSKMNAGIHFTHRPKALTFDYKVQLSGSSIRIRETGFSRKKEISGKDQCEALLLLQKRWEDGDGNIHAMRVGTMWKRFSSNTSGWKEKQTFPIHYGNISKDSYFRSFMDLQTEESERVYYAKNRKGKLVKVIEEGWADESETPTHMIIYFNSSHGGAYIGSPGNTMWVDNVKLEY